MKKTIYLLISAAIFAVLLSIILLSNGIVWFVNPDKSKFNIRGIDISHHNGRIDWLKLKESGTVFVIIKATEGDDHVDHMFDENWNKSGENGFVRGAYHFFSLRIGGVKQAENFMNTVPLSDNVLPPVVDLEFGGNSKVRPSKKDFAAELAVFMKLLEDRYGQKPVIYSTHEFFDRYLSDEFPEYKIWMRDIFREPAPMKDGRIWTFWQYKSRGHLEGIDGFVDMNVFNGDEKEFERLLKKQE
jgi:lysozyme